MCATADTVCKSMFLRGRVRLDHSQVRWMHARNVLKLSHAGHKYEELLRRLRRYSVPVHTFKIQKQHPEGDHLPTQISTSSQRTKTKPGVKTPNSPAECQAPPPKPVAAFDIQQLAPLVVLQVPSKCSGGITSKRASKRPRNKSRHRLRNRYSASREMR